MENGMAAISMGRWVLVDIKVLVKHITSVSYT